MNGTSEKITAYVEPQLKRELQQIAAAKQTTVTSLARIALAAYVLREMERSGALK